MSQAYNIIIDHGVSVTGNGREAVSGLNATNKRVLFHLMKTVKLPGSKYYYTQMAMHLYTQNVDVSLYREFQKHLPSASQKNGVIDQGKYRKWASKWMWKYQ